MKASIQKTTAEGEVIVMEVPAKDPAELGIRMRAVLAMLDDRQLEMNRRVITAHTMMKDLDPAVQQMVKSVHEILYGSNVEHNVAAIAEAKQRLLEQRSAFEERAKASVESDGD